METTQKELHISSRTTGFASPAESYVDKRLDLNDLIVDDFKTTFYFKYGGVDTLGVKKGNVLVVDKKEIPNEGDLVVLTDKTCLKIRKYEGQKNLWGKVTWILNKL
jgi:DNA polymerase V